MSHNTRTDPFSESLIGKTIRDYRVESRLGSGGMGDVYRAVHQTIGRQVAIKALKRSVAADPVSVERFFAEARVVNAIRHENIVDCTDLIQEEEGAYMIMELLEGRTLGGLIRETGKIGAMRAVRIAAQIADGIGAAHEAGVIHRDLKPENVFLIRRSGSNDYVKILDFGIARLRPEQHTDAINMTETGQVIGTPAYMSPEQAMGQKVTPAADIYTLGVIVFQMLTGKLPFPGPSMPEVMIGHMSEPPPPIRDIVPEVPAQLAKVVGWALEKQPDARPRGMFELRTALLDAVGIDPEDQVLSRDPQPVTEARARGESRVGKGVDWAGATVDASRSEGRKLVVSAGDADPDSWRDATVGTSDAELKPIDPARVGPDTADGSGTRDLRSKLVTGDGEHRAASAQPDTEDVRPGRRSVPVVAIAVAAVAAIAVVAAVVLTRGGDPPVSAAAIDGAVETGGAAASTAKLDASPRVAALRAQLSRAVASFDEPVPPAECQTHDPATLERLIAVAVKITGGKPGGARPQDEQAVARLEAVTGVDRVAEHWHWLAKARLYAGVDPDLVVEASARAFGLCDDYSAAHAVAGTARFRAGKPLAAEAHYQNALRAEPAFVNARYNLGLIQVATKRASDAATSFSWILEREPDDADALVGRARALLGMKQSEAAAADLERAIAIVPKNAVALLMLGVAYQQLGRASEAKDAFCRAAALGEEKAKKLCKR